MRLTYVALDLETTGLDPARDEIIEVGAVTFSDGQELDRFTTLVNPGRAIPPEITDLTGISGRDVATAPRFSAIRERLARFVGDAVVVGHNVQFDLAFLQRQGCLQRHPHIDTLELATILMPDQQRYGLDKLTERLGIEPDRRHRALADARATMALLIALQQQADALPLDVLHRINSAAGAHDWTLMAVFEQAERRARHSRAGAGAALHEPRSRFAPAAQMDEAARYGPLVPVDERTALDVEALTAMLEPGGALERGFPGFEYRTQQIEMMRAVADCFNHSRHLVVEAGTGTGKSIAYLLPAAYWAVQNGERVVVSTNTINLQDQLCRKDIPDLQKVLPFEVRATVLKGRSNYLCPRRLEALESKRELSSEELRVLTKVLVWLPTTTTGDRSELSMYRAEEWSVWARISSDANTCTADRCWYRRQGLCFYQRARRMAESAHLVIVNHALLLSDVATENRVLPQYNYLIVDEAHHLESATTNQLGYNVSRWAVESLLAQIGLSGRSFGGLTAQALLCCRGRVTDEAFAELEEAVGAVHEANEGGLRGLRDLFDDLRAFVEAYRDTEGLYDYRISLTRDLRIQPEWEHVELAWDGLAERLGDVGAALDRLLQVLGDLGGLDLPGHEDSLQEGAGLQQQLETTVRQIEAIVLEPDEASVTWVQATTRMDDIYLCAVPLHVGHLVERHLLWTKEAVVFTSATLRTSGEFGFIKERLGAADADELAVGSPFDYASQVLLYLPTDLPGPNEPSYEHRLNQGLIELAVATQGRMLVLFTSYRQLRATHSAIHRALANQQITVYTQGGGASRSQLLDAFRTTSRAVLLGTRSFWEGVDVPGEALSCLVVTKLPFAVPTDPVFAARAAEMDEPFYQYAVPDAILRFRQGFGRLIRTRSDRGVVVVMDGRIESKGYGAMFVDSLPSCTVVRGPMAALPTEAALWIAEGRTSTPPQETAHDDGDGELEYVSFDEL
ncbi:MAG: DEAD/DEAH box helicase family protein [Anaerolineae bacterium]|nr:DEAD/DEAH box helicase family protein [Anaerolineae bacterium]